MRLTIIAAILLTTLPALALGYPPDRKCQQIRALADTTTPIYFYHGIGFYFCPDTDNAACEATANRMESTNPNLQLAICFAHP